MSYKSDIIVLSGELKTQTQKDICWKALSSIEMIGTSIQFFVFIEFNLIMMIMILIHIFVTGQQVYGVFL